jgi:hypothetical protein
LRGKNNKFRIAGMRLNHADKIIQQAKTDRAALLRVELNSIGIPATN